MKVRSIAHKGLRRLYEEDSSNGVSADSVDKLRKMLSFLDAMSDPGGATPPSALEGTHSHG